MTTRESVSELAAARHDLLNILTSLQHGCTLIVSRLPETEYQDLHAFLREMLRRIEDANDLIEGLRRFDEPPEQSAGTV